MAWLGLDLGRRDCLSIRPRRPASRSRRAACWRAARPIAALPRRRSSRRCATQQRAAGKPMRYDGRWRDRDPAEAPPGAPFVVRLKAPQTGETIVHDVVQGDVRFANDQLDDMVLLRSRRHADLYAGGRGRRLRHGRHPRHPRRRSPQQRRRASSRSSRRWAGPCRSMAICR